VIKALIFDIGQVLLRFDFQIALRKLRGQCEVTDLAAALRDIEPDKRKYERGDLSRSAFLAAVFSRLRYCGTEAEFVTCWSDIFWPNERMVQLVEQLAGRYPLYLLSNTSCIHLPPLLDKYPFFRHFRDGVYSYVAGLEKPDVRIYELAAQQFAVEPAHTLFIDDLPENVAGAQKAGFAAWCYDHTRHQLFEAWLREHQIFDESPSREAI
jgi:putative hydrolase of the HAD superfamily